MPTQLRSIVSLPLLLVCLLWGGGALRAQIGVPVPNFIAHYGDLTGADAAYTGSGQFKFALVSRTAPITAYWKNDNNVLIGAGESPVIQPIQALTLQVTEGNFGVFLGYNDANNLSIPYATFSHPGLRVRAWYRKGTTGTFVQLPDVDLPAAGYAMQIPDGSITTPKLAANSVTATALANGSVGSGKLAVGAISVGNLQTATAPAAGQVLGYNGSQFVWTGAGGGVFILNGTSAYYNGGNVGLGTMTPSSKLEIAAQNALTMVGFQPYLTFRDTSVTNKPSFIQGINGDLLLLTASKASLVLKDTTGNVGIGTSTPAHRLSVVDGPLWTTNSWFGSLQLVNGSAIGWNANGGGQRFGMGHTNTGFCIFRTASDLGLATNGANYDFFIDDSGNVGLGTLTPAAKLEVDGSVRVNNTSGIQVSALDAPIITRGFDPFDANAPNNKAGVGRWGLFMEPSSLVCGFPDLAGRTFDVRKYTPDGGAQLLFRILQNGNVGIGTGVNPGPQEKLHVIGNILASGSISCSVLTIRGADVAEPFDIAEQDLPRGTVVVIDERRHGGLKRSTTEYDTCVAGIVSGANGVNSGLILSQPGVNEGGQNVAISGRVYVQADATKAPIKAGDLLTTSDLPGYAMKVTDHARAQGAVLGKAMSSLSEGTGMVLVLVTLQ